MCIQKNPKNKAYQPNDSLQLIKIDEKRSFQSWDGFTSQRWVNVCFVLYTSLLHSIFNSFTCMYIIINLPYEIHCCNIMSPCVLLYLSHFSVFHLILLCLCLLLLIVNYLLYLTATTKQLNYLHNTTRICPLPISFPIKFHLFCVVFLCIKFNCSRINNIRLQYSTTFGAYCCNIIFLIFQY